MRQPYFENDSVTLFLGDALSVCREWDRPLVHCVVTSPPYYKQRKYNAGESEMGLESTPDQYVQVLCTVLDALPLREDGVLFLNLGDSYAGKGESVYPNSKQATSMKSLDLMGIPWMVAFELRHRGWYLRSDIIWHKPNPMPESVRGWSWSRHRIKLRSADQAEIQRQMEIQGTPRHRLKGIDQYAQAVWEDCPGCDRCSPNGLILSRSAWRPTSAYEHIFMLTKSDRYYCDLEAIAEPLAWKRRAPSKNNKDKRKPDEGIGNSKGLSASKEDKYYAKVAAGEVSTRNVRNVWTIPTRGTHIAHYASFPLALPERCILAVTSEAGCCPVCGNQWARVIKKHVVEGSRKRRKHADTPGAEKGPTSVFSTGDSSCTTSHGWRATCDHNEEPVQVTVLDPFSGIMTTGLAAVKHNRKFLGIELKEEYIQAGLTRKIQRKLPIPYSS